MGQLRVPASWGCEEKNLIIFEKLLAQCLECVNTQKLVDTIILPGNLKNELSWRKDSKRTGSNVLVWARPTGRYLANLMRHQRKDITKECIISRMSFS